MKYKIMVKKGGQGLGEPMIRDIRKRRFTSKKEADAYCAGINDYRRNTVSRITTEFVTVKDGFSEDGEE